MSRNIGDWRTPTLAVTPGDATTVATLAIVDPDGAVTANVVGAGTVADGTASFLGTAYQLTTAGRWTERWSVTGTGKGAEDSRDSPIDVLAAAPVPATLAGAHATSGDYATLIGGTIPAKINSLLRRASRDVDRALLSAVYDPADADVLAALKEATCERVNWYLAQGWADGVPVTYQSVSIGSISLTRSYTGAGGDASARAADLDMQTWLILQLAGLTGMAPQTG